MYISFIIPAFNCADTLEESIASVYNGNFVNGDEVVIINDASTDNTPALIKELQGSYAGIKSYHHNINKGSAAAARNTAIDYAVNELLFCLDADNILIKESVPLLKNHLIDENADIAAFGEIHFFLSGTKEVTHKWMLKKKISFVDNINTPLQTPCSAGNYLFTKESWKRAGRYTESIGGAYDSWAFGTKQLAAGCNMITLPGTHYLHRQGYESTFMRESGKVNTSITILQVLLPYLEMLHPDDVNFIMSEDGRYTWFERTGERQIRLKSKNHKLSVSKKVLRKAVKMISGK